MAQDDYYYEIQLTNKQLVFYFMAGASGLVLSFLAGIMVGRGVDPSAEVQAASSSVPAFEEKIIKEEPPVPKATSLPADQLTYTSTLQSDKTEVVRSEPKVNVSIPVTTLPPTGDRRSDLSVRSEPLRPAATTAAPPSAPAAAADSGDSTVTIQVGAYKEKAYADSQASSLKKKGYAAFVVNPDGAHSLFNVRVGPYSTRTAAEKVQKQLVAEKLKPFIVER